MSPTFLNFYDLHQQPFGVSPDPAFLYLSRTHTEALTSLANGIREGRGFFALIAEPGMGKTTLLYQLLEGLRDYARTAFLFQTQCDSREFFEYLLSELRVDTEGMGLVAMHNKSNEILFAEMLAGKRFVLIVDEAQDLEDSVLETIRLLSNYETPHTKLLQIILAGQPQLASKLASPGWAQLHQRLTVLSHLEPLSAVETACYIEHRLEVAGYRGEPLFLPEAAVVIAERSQGVPRNINKICFNALSEAYGQGRRKITPEVVEKVAGKLDVGFLERSVPPLPSSARQVFPQAGPRSIYRRLAEFRWTREVFSTVVLACTFLSGGLAASLSRKGPAFEARFEAFFKRVPKFEKASPTPQAFPVIAKDQEKDRGHKSDAQAEVVEPPESNRDTPTLRDIQTSNDENHTRVVVTLDNAVTYDSGRISSPDRIYFDLYKAGLSPSLESSTVPVGNGLLTSLRAAQNEEGVRLVLRVRLTKSYLAHMEWSPYRLVIDLYGKPIGPVNTAAMKPSSPNPETDTSKPNLTIQPPSEPKPKHDGRQSLTHELGLKTSRVVIDPGHGGQDTGAAGPHGLLEKDLCLDVALRLGHLIEQNLPGAEVIFTRQDDTYIPLENRTAIANQANADIFISIHANSSQEHGVRGVETYYLNFATIHESMGVATRENALSQSSLHDLQDLIQRIAHNEKIDASKELATDIQNALSGRLLLVSRNEMKGGVKKAPFVVLIAAEMPSVLSEISFVSNASDERLLRHSDHRERIAEGLYAGIAAYLNGLCYNKQKPVTDIPLATVSRSGTTTVGSTGKAQ